MTKKKTSLDRRLAAWLYREIAVSHLMMDDLFEDAEFSDPENESMFFYMMERFNFLIGWLDDHYDMFSKSTECDEFPEFKKFDEEFDDYMRMPCEDCHSEFKFFMVNDDIWEKHGCGEGFLCLECLEKRVGKKFVGENFTDCLLNDENEVVRNLRGLPPLPPLPADEEEKLMN